MTALVILLAVLFALALGALLFEVAGVRRPRFGRTPRTRTRRIIFPFVADALSPRALDAALRLAAAEDATLVPIFLARVPLYLPLDAPLPRQSAMAIPLQEAIEQRAARFDVPVDARIERGRTYRHALRQVIAAERFDRLVIAAAAQDSPGFAADDVAWLLNTAPEEIVVLRPAKGEMPVPVRRSRRRLMDRRSPDRRRTPTLAG
jgi:hypothetical protein